MKDRRAPPWPDRANTNPQGKVTTTALGTFESPHPISSSPSFVPLDIASHTVLLFYASRQHFALNRAPPRPAVESMSTSTPSSAPRLAVHRSLRRPLPPCARLRWRHGCGRRVLAERRRRAGAVGRRAAQRGAAERDGAAGRRVAPRGDPRREARAGMDEACASTARVCKTQMKPMVAAHRKMHRVRGGSC
eukprot:2861020-Pleurochrysis_carterae.AAC.1